MGNYKNKNIDLWKNLKGAIPWCRSKTECTQSNLKFKFILELIENSSCCFLNYGIQTPSTPTQDKDAVAPNCHVFLSFSSWKTALLPNSLTMSCANCCRVQVFLHALSGVLKVFTTAHKSTPISFILLGKNLILILSS